MHKTWTRLSKNRWAMAGLCIIAAAFLACVFAYMIAPDCSPDANDMTVEIGGKPPGFSIRMLLERSDRIVSKGPFFSRLWHGQQLPWVQVPITGYRFNGYSLFISHYVDENITEPDSLDIRKIILPGGKNRSLADMQKFIVQHQIVQKVFWLGTDKFGRDLLSRMIIGVRISFSVGLIAVVISLLAGILLGAAAGYYGGWADKIIMWLINVTWSIPTLLLVFAITVALGKGFWQIFVAVGLTMWVNVARIIRGQVITLKEMGFILAARALGLKDSRIILRHVLPNVTGPVMVVAANNFAVAIVVEAGLSFLGIGVQPPLPSWGLMLKENYGFIITHNPFPAIIPGLAISVLVLAFNLVGNGLRDAMDTRSAGSRHQAVR